MILYLSMLTMLIDHIGLVFFPEHEWLRIIGRIAFPLYAFGIVTGYKHTRNLKYYIKRLFILALISQIPFIIVSQSFRLNVIFTFILCIATLYILDNKKKYISIPFLLIIAILAHFTADYGAYAIALTLIYKYTSGYKMLYAHLSLNFIFILSFGFGWIIQLFSVIATLIIINRDKLKDYKVNKLLYRSFYPVHLSLISLLIILLK